MRGKIEKAAGEDGSEGYGVRFVLDKDESLEYTNSEKQKGDMNNEDGKDSSVLAGRAVSTSYRSEHNIRQHGKNTKLLQGLLGYSDTDVEKYNLRAGETGWLEDYQGANGFGKPDDKQKARRFLQSVSGKLSRTKLKNVDTVCRRLPSNVQHVFADTVFKTEEGIILSLWHWTNRLFSAFERGDIGFHAGTLAASHAIMFDKSGPGEIGFFKKISDLRRDRARAEFQLFRGRECEGRCQREPKQGVHQAGCAADCEHSAFRVFEKRSQLRPFLYYPFIGFCSKSQLIATDRAACA